MWVNIPRELWDVDHERASDRDRLRRGGERRHRPMDLERTQVTMMNHRYRKRPVVIEAFQMTREARVDNRDWPSWLNRAWNLSRSEPGAVFPTIAGTGDGTVSINTLEGQNHFVSFDDWIIQGVQGDLHPCKPDIFSQTHIRDKSRIRNSVKHLVRWIWKALGSP